VTGIADDVQFGGTSVMITTLFAPIFAPWPLVIVPAASRARADRHVVLHGRVALPGQSGAAQNVTPCRASQTIIADVGRLASHPVPWS